MDPQLVNYNGQLINLNGGVLANKFPIRDGLVIYFDADIDKSYPDSGVDLNNLGVSAHVGELKNGLQFVSSGIPHFQFDGSDDLISVPRIGTEFTTSSSTTFNLWYFSYASNYSQGGNLLNYLKGGWIGYQITNTGVLVYSGQNGSNELGKAVHNAYDGGWRMLTFIIDRENNEYRGYLNGINVSSVTTSATHPPIATLGNLTLGCRDLGYLQDQHVGNVQLGSFMMYERALTDEEILQTYNESKARLFPPIKTDGLVLHLDAFDNKSVGNALQLRWYDLSPSSNDATLNNMSHQNYVIQNEIPSYLFDGTDDYATVDGVFDSFSGLDTPFSVEIVFDGIRPGGGSTWAYVLHNNTTTTVGTSFITVGIKNNGNYFASVMGLYNDMETSVAETSGSVTHLTFTYDGSSNQKVYINNVLEASSGSTQAYNYDTTTSLGSTYRNAGYRPVDGNIYEVRVYDRALTDDEIAYNFEARRGRYGI